MGPDEIRVLGIDPGSRLTGFGVIDCVGDTASYVASGAIRTGTGSFPDRLRLIFSSICDIMNDYGPQIVAVETVFMHKNAGSALKLGHARSAAICATFEFEVEVFEYAPREIKRAIVGSGAGTKEQVQHMVKSLLRLQGEPSADAADALATALCHAHQQRLKARLSEDSLHSVCR